MAIRSAAILAGALAFGLVAANVASAEDAKPPTPTAAALSDAHAKVTLANGLIALGRADKDALMLTVALKLLASVDTPVVDPASVAGGGKPQNYDLAAIAAEAKTFAGDNKGLLEQVMSVPMTKAGKIEVKYCAWAWECNAIDCGYTYGCGY